MTVDLLAAVANHLWQSTLFAGIVALLAVGFRKQRASLRYWIWTAASLKFLLPFSVLVGIGAHIHWSTASPVAKPRLMSVVNGIGQPFLPTAQTPVNTFSSSPANTQDPPLVLFGLWLCGAAAVAFVWVREWRRVRKIVRTGTPLVLNVPLRAVSIPACIEPGVVGILRSVLILPEGIMEQLSKEQLDAIVLHELCHVRRRDNLAAFLHMIVESVFWFHPLVWWIERKLLEERERACDEEVVRLTGKPEEYAEGILGVCRLYAGSSLICVSGVTGSGLKKRIEEIMRAKVFERLNAAGKAALASVSIATLALPLLVGVINTPQMRAQSAQPLAFEVASIKENKGDDPRSIRMQYLPGGRFSTTAIPLRWLIAEAYGLGVQSSRMSFEPDFGRSLGSGQYDIEAVAPKGAIPADATGAVQTQIVRRMLQTLLADRFRLVIRRETKALPVYAIVVAKNGPKLRRSVVQEKDCRDNLTTTAEGMPCHRFNGGQGRGLHGDAVNIVDLAGFVENWTDHPVIDRTGLTGLYNIQTSGWRPLRPVQLTPDGRPPTAEQLAFADPSTPTVFDIFEELGLKLELQNAPIETIVLVSVQRPSEN